MNNIVFLSILLLTVFPLATSAVEIHPRAGTTAAAFLKLGIGARADSMGTAFTGLADDVTALYWNPAGLTQLSQRELSVTHNESFENIRHDFAGYSWRYKSCRLAAAVYGLYIPTELERRSGLDENDPFEPLSPAEGLFGAYDVCAQFSGAAPVSPALSLGTSLKIIQQSIDDASAFGAALDAGAFYRAPGSRLSLGCGLFNFGTPVKFRDKAYVLPMSFRGGAAWRWSMKVTATLDIIYPYDNFPSVAAGAEFKPLKMIALRGGYRYRLYGMELDGLSGLSVGMGLNVPLRTMGVSFDYAFVPYGVLGNSQRISLTLRFGPSSEPQTMRTPPPQPQPAAAAPADQPPPAAPMSAQALAEDATGYAFTSFAVTKKLKRASGRSVWYTLHGDNPDSELYAFAATIRSPYNDQYRFEVGCKDGTGPVYRSYRIRTNCPFRLERVSAKIRLPEEINRPMIKTEQGTAAALVKHAEDAGAVTYTFELPYLQDFTVYYAQ